MPSIILIALLIRRKKGIDCGAPRLSRRAVHLAQQDGRDTSTFFGETRRSVSSFAKATEDTHLAFIHGLTAVAFCEGG